MKLVYIGVFRRVADTQTAHRLAFVHHLADFGYFTRGTIAELIQFAARQCVQRTQPGCRQTIDLEDRTPFSAHTYVRGDGLAGVVMADKEYPMRVAFTLLTKELAAYEERVGASWKGAEADQAGEQDFLQRDIVQYQDPRQADKLTAVQTQLDEVRGVMHNNIEALLQRGETLDELMEKSHDLHSTSLKFFKEAKRVNACCKY